MALEITFAPGSGTITGHDIEITPAGGSPTVVHTTVGVGLADQQLATYIAESADETITNVVRIRSVNADGPGEWSLPQTILADATEYESVIQLGRDASAPPLGEGIISATFSEEVESIDVSNRSNVGGTAGAPGYKVIKAGFVTRTWEIECHDPDGLITSLAAAGNSWSVMSVTENIGIDGAVTYSVTVKEF